MSAPDHFPELAATLQAIRERVRRRIESSSPSLPELHLPPHERIDPTQVSAPQGLATAIGKVNPRSGGVGNNLIQKLKQAQARLSDWQLRPQREFNVAVVGALQKISEVLEAIDRSSVTMRNVLGQYGREIKPAVEQRENDLYRELDALCEQITQQRWSYEGALMRQSQALSAAEEELRQLRQRVANQAKVQAARPEGVAVAPAANGRNVTPIEIDYLSLERDFRGSEQEINRRQRFYLPFFQGRKNILDIACGRGEFLELMREAEVPARGVDLDADMVGRCLEKGLDVQQADVFAYLAQVPDGSLDGVFSAQFVEHLEAGDYLRLITQCAGKLAPGGVLAIETQNPECLAIFSQSFYIDPTHVRPIPPAQLRYAFASAGLEKIATYPLSPAAAVLPVLPKLPAGSADPDVLRAFNVAVEKFNETFLGGMDYAAIGYRPA